MITNGFRLYRGEDGELMLDQILEGGIYALVPNNEDKDRELGYYDTDFRFVVPDDRGFEFFTEEQLANTYKIVKRGAQWCAVSEDGSHSMGCYPTEAQAKERLRQVEAAKAVKK